MDDITLERFADELRELAAEDPDRRNPLVDPDDEYAGCSYRQENGDGSVSRCIIGEWLHRKGYETRDYHEGSSADAVMTDLFGEDVVDWRVRALASAVQRFVDRNEDDDWRTPRKRWIEAKPAIDEALEQLRKD